jgi:hypothetical protein
MQADLSPAYRATLRTLLRFASAMIIVALLAGLLFQESSKQLSFFEAPSGLHLEATIRLALVHGHVFTTAVLIPIAAAAALMIARRIGGAELTNKSLRWLTRVYLPLVCLALALMLWKAYHLLLAVRGGETDLDAINESFFFGMRIARAILYGGSHTGMAIGLGVFGVALFRSLGAGKLRD